MLNEIQEFKAYTEKVSYSAKSKNDKTYLGRFTFDMIENNYGFERVLTIIARGYMFKNGNADIEYARKALCAWCSIPKTKNAPPLMVTLFIIPMI